MTKDKSQYNKYFSKFSTIQAANYKYKAVKSLEAAKTTKRSYFYDTKTKILFVSVPVEEKKTVKIK